MSVFRWSIVVLFAGVVCAWAVNGIAGEVLMVAGASGILYSMIRVVEADTSPRQDEMDARADEIRRRHQNAI
jgi:hypothetical protein